MSNVNELIRAINNKKQILLKYGDDQNERLANPYILGIYGSDLHLHAYQITEPSSSGEPTGWKHFKLKKICSLLVKKDEFEPDDPGYNSEHPHYSNVHAKIPPPSKPPKP